MDTKGSLGWSGGEQVPPAALNPPLNVEAAIEGTSAVKVSWVAPVKGDATGYRVYHADDNRVFAAFATWGASDSVVLNDDSGGPYLPDSTYKFIVVTTDGSAVESINSNMASITFPPQDAQGSGLLLANPRTATGWRVADPGYVSSVQGSGLLLANPRTNTGWRVADPTGELPPKIPVAAPTLDNFYAVNSTALDLAWTDNQLTPSDSFLITVKRVSDGSNAPGYPKQVSGVTTDRATALQPSTAYEAYLVATVGADTSGLSNTLQATTNADNTLPPPTGPGWTKTLNFDSGTPGQLANGPDAFDAQVGDIGAITKTVYDNTTSARGSQCAKCTIEVGLTAFGSWGGKIFFPQRVYRGETMYLTLHMMVPSSFSIKTGANSMKWIRLYSVRIDGSNNFNGGAIDIQLMEDASTKPYDYRMLREYQNIWFPWSSTVSLRRDIWMKYDVEIYMDHVPRNDGGNAYIKAWIDGQLVADEGGIQTITRSDDYLKDMLMFSYFNGSAPKTQHLYLDDITLGTQKPDIWPRP